jgi:hypothetical protein
MNHARRSAASPFFNNLLGGQDRRQHTAGDSGLKKLVREAMPKGPLEVVAEARRILDPIRTSEDLRI